MKQDEIMKTILRAGSLLGAVVLLSSCASSSRNSDTALAPKVKPTYFDKVTAQRIEDWDPGVACPLSQTEDSKVEWKKLANLAAACVKIQNWGQVEKLGNQLSIHGRLTPWGPYFLALAAEARRDFPRALWMLELGLKKAPREGILHYQLGRIRWQMGDDVLALQSLHEASNLNPSLTDAHWVDGMLALNAGKLGEAEVAFEKALANQSSHWLALMALAEVKLRGKDFSRAENLLQRALRFNDRSLRARLALAFVQEVELKKFREALGSYQDIKRLSAENKLDATLNMNLEEKIRSVESELAKAEKLKISSRQPASPEGKVAQ